MAKIMTQSERLRALIQKAIDGGFTVDLPVLKVYEDSFGDITIGSMIQSEDLDDWWFSEDYDKYSVNDLIFNHDFAKALFGEESDGTEFINGMYGEQPKYRWRYRLQQAVISDDPIGYMYSVVFP